MNSAASGHDPRHAERRRALRARVTELERLPQLRLVPAGESPGPARFAALAKLCAMEGPVFAGFGRYLSFRPDLLDQDDRTPLAVIPDRDEPMAIPVIPDVAIQTTRCTRLFDTLWEGHHRLGTTVMVRLVRTVDEHEFDLLLELERVMTPLMDSLSVHRAIDDYRRWHERYVNCEAWAVALARLEESGARGLPRILPELTRRDRLVFTKPPGQTLANVVAHGSMHHRRTVARQLNEAWLEQLAGIGYLPLSTDLDLLQWSVDGELQHPSSGHAMLPASSRARVLDALLAVSDDQSYRVAACLTGEMDALEGASSPDEVAEDCSRLAPITQSRKDFRLSVSTTQKAFLYLRASWRLGYRSRAPLADMIVSLAMLHDATQQLDETEDVLLDALRAVRMRKLFVEVQDLIRPGSWPAELQTYISAAVDGPDRIRQGLSALSTRATDSNVSRRARSQPPLWSTVLLGGLLAFLVTWTKLEAVFPESGPAIRVFWVVVVIALLLRTLRR